MFPLEPGASHGRRPVFVAPCVGHRCDVGQKPNALNDASVFSHRTAHLLRPDAPLFPWFIKACLQDKQSLRKQRSGWFGILREAKVPKQTIRLIFVSIRSFLNYFCQAFYGNRS